MVQHFIASLKSSEEIAIQNFYMIAPLLVFGVPMGICSMFHIFVAISGVSLVTPKSAVDILELKLDKSKHLIEVPSLTSLKSIKAIRRKNALVVSVACA
ncbi:hypothetical protein ERJ75_001268100 [Trypanosoma vivax]|nr:hypothetical protein ERJ75_001268100 [Trypanosoma vivax]